MSASANSTTRSSTTLSSSDIHPLPQCLPLEPITLGIQKNTRSSELRRVLGIPFGNALEDHSFGVVNSKSPPLVIEELKNFKGSVQDASRKARDRAKMLRGSIFKLDRYKEALTSVKRKRTDLLSNERLGQDNSLKMGGQILSGPHDHRVEKLEAKTKSSSLGIKKHIRTSMLDAWTDGRSTDERQNIVIEKDRDMHKASGGDAIHVKEKFPRLPAGGGGWDQKMKRKRSVGAVGNRAFSGDREIKQVINSKSSVHSKLHPTEAQACRSRASPGVTGIHKSVEAMVPTNSSFHISVKNNLECVSSSRDRTTITDERVMANGSNKTSIPESHAGSIGSRIKGKLSGTPRTGSVAMLDLSFNVHHKSGTHGGGEHTAQVNKAPPLIVEKNKKRPISSNSSPHHMAHWVGQRPLKISRTRRANLVSPVSDTEKFQISSEGLTSEFGARTCESGSSLLGGSLENCNLKFQMKLEKFPSPSEENAGDGEYMMKEKRVDTGVAAVIANDKVEAFVLLPGKNKVLAKGNTGDGVLYQERKGSLLSSSKPVATPKRIVNLPAKKPLQSMGRGLDKNRSKSGRLPPKKPISRKTSIRSGHMINSGSPVVAGESDDDREQLLVAAASARNARQLACAGPFWKKMECYFASVTSQDASYLKHQINFAEEVGSSFFEMLGDETNTLGDLMHKEAPIYSGVRPECHANQESINSDALCGGVGMKRMFVKAPPLYQRVLSAMIEEDESEELHLQIEGRNMSFQCVSDDSHCGSCNHMDVEPKDRDRMESEVESEIDLQAQKCCPLDRISCNKTASSNTDSNRSISSSVCNNEQWQADDGLSYSDAELHSQICQNDLGFSHSSEVQVSLISPFDSQYQMLSMDERLLMELQSIGLCPEIMPHLGEGEEGINQDIMELHAGLFQEVGKLKKNLEKIDKAIPYARDAEIRYMEQVAMGKLIEMAYRKKMAFHGNRSSKRVIRKVPKQDALAFAKRTLARCQKFYDTGRSCFNEAALLDIMFSASTGNNDDVKSVICVGSRIASNRYNISGSHKPEPMGSAIGVVSGTHERSEFHGDNLHIGSSDKQRAVTQSHRTVLNKGKKKEVLLNDVGITYPKVTPVGSVKGNRNQKNTDQNRGILMNNSVSSTGRPSVGSCNCKSKAKTRQKISYLSTSGEGLQSIGHMEETHPAISSAQLSTQSMANASNMLSKNLSTVNVPGELSVEEKNPADLSDEQLNQLGSFENEDYSSLLDFDVDGVQDYDSLGLEIPMDNLADLHMLM